MSYFYKLSFPLCVPKLDWIKSTYIFLSIQLQVQIMTQFLCKNHDTDTGQEEIHTLASAPPLNLYQRWKVAFVMYTAIHVVSYFILKLTKKLCINLYIYYFFSLFLCLKHSNKINSQLNTMYLQVMSLKLTFYKFYLSKNLKKCIFCQILYSLKI